MTDHLDHAPLLDAGSRLPRTVRPIRYDLTLAPDLAAASFDGSVSIRAIVDEATDKIVLHALDLDIAAAQVRVGLPDDPEMLLATVTLDAATETAVLHLDRTLDVGPIEVVLQFRGVLNDQLVGFYRSTFTTTDGDGTTTEHTLAVTQFESTHARRAFPCFDEPDRKAIFSITLVVDDGEFVVANTAEFDRSHSEGKLTVRFADTIVMSTYLVAFVIGPLEATPVREVAGIDGPIPLRVIYPPGSAHLCDFALDVADAALRFFEDYYGIAYPGDKVDLVAVPDFAFGAMENLGCITFREVLLLVDPDRATQPELQRVADVINHELAHMWFGDLVTMSWWNGIWLNEAFATFMEIKASDSFRPDWDVWTTFGLARAAAFDTDSLHETRPIEYEVVTAADAEGMFDILTYEKGASVVRMLEQYLGEDVFRRGISTYLQRHAFGNTETTDLWDALEEVSGEPVRHIMDSWIYRGGYPLVEVTTSPTGFSLDQRRAAFGEGESPDDSAWPVPMVLSASADSGRRGVDERLLFEDPTTFDLGAPAALVQANVGGAGFYRVQLDAGLRNALIQAPTTTALERFVLIDDTWFAFVAGRIGVVEAAQLVAGAARRERAEQPPVASVWRRIAGASRALVRLTPGAERDAASEFVAAIAGPALVEVEQRLAAEPNDADLDVRSVLFALAGGAGESATVRERARQIFGQDPMPGDAALVAASIEVVAGDATPEEYERLLSLWRGATNPQDEIRLLYALVETTNPELFARALELSVTEVRSQNGPYLLGRALGNAALGTDAWRFIESRWDTIVERFPSSSVPRMLEGIRGITDAEVARSVEAFLSDHPTPSGEKVVRQHLERMWVSVATAQRVADEFGGDPRVLSEATAAAPE